MKTIIQFCLWVLATPFIIVIAICCALGAKESE